MIGMITTTVIIIKEMNASLVALPIHIVNGASVNAMQEPQGSMAVVLTTFRLSLCLLDLLALIPSSPALTAALAWQQI